jgi:putative salt-induced outer membrane protein YdiY
LLQKISAITMLLFFITGLGALFPLKASADEIIMDNGARIKGTVTNLVGDFLSLTSDYSEPIKLKTSKIIGITTDNPVEIQMKNGEILKRNLKTSADGVLTIEQATGSNRVVIDLKNISAINPAPVCQWSGSVVAAGNYQTGNTDRSAFRLGLDAVRRSDKDRFSMSFIYDISDENDTLTSRSFYGALKYDYFFTKKFYGYLGVELLNDKFKDLNLRTIVGPGVGYQVWDVPMQALAVEAGLTCFSEDYKIANSKSWISGRFAANYRYKITETIMFTNNLVLYQSLEIISDFSLRNEAAITTSLGSGWSMKLANTLEYNNAPAVGIKNTDSYFLLGLQYVLK